MLRGYSLLAIGAMILIGSCAGCGLAGYAQESWAWFGLAGSLGLAGLGLAVLAALDTV